MFFSKIALKIGTAKPTDLVGLARDTYKQHQLVWRFFPDAAKEKRNFLFRRNDNAKLAFFLVSASEPKADESLWSIETKPYEPNIKIGQRLSFSLRANPVRTKKPDELDSNPKKRKRHDVVMEAKSSYEREEKNWSDHKLQSQLIQEAGFEWINSKAEKYGFRVNSNEVAIENYCCNKFRKRDGLISISTLDFNGVLTVSDPEIFIKTLYQGIGPAKGFGCGLLLVRRI